MDRWSKILLTAKLGRRFTGQIDVVLHPSVLKLLAENYSAKSVAAYKSHIKQKHLHNAAIRKAWVYLKLANLIIRFVFTGKDGVGPNDRVRRLRLKREMENKF